MKLFFLLLVLVNVLLYAWQQGAFGRATETGREPERVARQIEAGRFRVLSDSEVKQLRQRAAEPRATMDLTVAQSCLEFGDFPPADAVRAESALLSIGTRPVGRAVEVPGHWLVYLPPAKTRGEADRRAAELRQKGVADLLVVSEDGPLRLAIRLGAFREVEAARTHLTSLQKLGVNDAQVAERPTAQTLTRYQMRDVSADAARQLGVLRKEFPAQTLRPC